MEGREKGVGGGEEEGSRWREKEEGGRRGGVRGEEDGVR